eukprot:PhF_6_TR3334/c0_g1_i2/m.4707
MFTRSYIRSIQSFANKTIVVTGAGSGLGNAVCRRVHALGGNIIAVDLDEKNGALLQQDLTEARCLYKRADVTSEEQVSAAISTTPSNAPIYGVVNCAGIATPSKVLGKKGPHDLGLFTKVLTINTIGTFNVVRLVAAKMASNNDAIENGVIINTASIAAYDGQVGQAAYASSKGAIVAMTLPLSRELSSSKIRVMTVAPGIMNTPMMAGLPKPAQEQLAAGVPFPKRFGAPDEFARLIQHIFENEYLNGEVIRMDGSLRMP